LGNAQNNFELTLPKPQSDLAKETLKDPYKFDFLTLEPDVQELQLEKSLTENITQFLLELGKGFAFVGRQYAIQVGKKERKLDLLFYHTKTISDAILKTVQNNWSSYNDTQKRILQHLFYKNQATIAELSKVTGIHENNVRLYINQFLENEKILNRLSEKKRDKNAKYAFKKL
jgi:hypothetical protein